MAANASSTIGRREAPPLVEAPGRVTGATVLHPDPAAAAERWEQVLGAPPGGVRFERGPEPRIAFFEAEIDGGVVRFGG